MKKILLMMFAALALMSCEGPQGPPGRDGFVNYKVIDLQINQNEWKYSNIADNNYYIATFNMPEITSYIYNNGVVSVYREYKTGTSNAIQTPLPQTRHKEYFDATANAWGFYTETVDYEYGVGFTSIVYTASDFAYTEDATIVPDAMHFRVVIQW